MPRTSASTRIHRGFGRTSAAVPSMSSHLTPNEIHAGLAWLAASGRVGYDLSEQTRFHRDLTVDADKILRRSPRLRGAYRLVEHNALTPNGPGWRVRGNNDTYDVSGHACSCPWHLTHGETRGPCKHVLAVALTPRSPRSPRFLTYLAHSPRSVRMRPLLCAHHDRRCISRSPMVQASRWSPARHRIERSHLEAGSTRRSGDWCCCPSREVQ